MVQWGFMPGIHFMRRPRLAFILPLLIATTASVGLLSCSREPGSRLPELVRQQARDADQRRKTAQAAAERERSIPAESAATTRFTVRPFEDWSLGEAAAIALGRIGESAVQALVAELANADARRRQQAADTLARIGPGAKDAVPALVALLDDPDPKVRKSAARALGQIGPAAAEAVPALVRVLGEPESPEKP